MPALEDWCPTCEEKNCICPKEQTKCAVCEKRECICGTWIKKPEPATYLY
jgi:hypothetical protein